MRDVQRWFGWLFVILPLHGVEQFLTGIDELYVLQRQMSSVLGLAPNPDYAIVLMVFVVVLAVMAMIYAALFGGGRARLAGPIFFGVAGLIEIHHVIKTLVNGAYFPGAVTAIPFVFIGFMLLRASLREWRTQAKPVTVAGGARVSQSRP